MPDFTMIQEQKEQNLLNFKKRDRLARIVYLFEYEKKLTGFL